MNYFVFFNDTATTEIYTLSLHDALPISVPAQLSRLHRLGDVGRRDARQRRRRVRPVRAVSERRRRPGDQLQHRSEEHTSELQSRQYLVCRLLLEKKTISSSFASIISTSL